MANEYDTVITLIKNALDAVYSKKTDLTTHNSANNAHSDIRNAIPTKTSDLTNDSGFATQTYVNNIIGTIEEDMNS